MNKFILSLFSALLFFSFQSAAQNGKDLSTDDFYAAVKNNKRIQLIDVRTPGEFNSAHLLGAENVDFLDRKFMEEISTLNKNKATYIYCKSGNRSGKAMKAMLDAGFTKVYNLSGGFMGWEQANLPTSKTSTGDKNPTGLTMEEFKKLTAGKTPVLVDFTATWCGPCKILKPRIKDLEKKNKGNLKVIYIDVDKNKELSNALKVRAIPLVHVYKNGKLVQESTGVISSSELKRMVR